MVDVARMSSNMRRWQTASNELPHDPEEWSLGHVAQWLKQMGLSKYIEKFEEQDIRGARHTPPARPNPSNVLGESLLPRRQSMRWLAQADSAPLPQATCCST